MSSSMLTIVPLEILSKIFEDLDKKTKKYFVYSCNHIHKEINSIEKNQRKRHAYIMHKAMKSGYGFDFPAWFINWNTDIYSYFRNFFKDIFDAGVFTSEKELWANELKDYIRYESSLNWSSPCEDAELTGFADFCKVNRKENKSLIRIIGTNPLTVKLYYKDGIKTYQIWHTPERIGMLPPKFCTDTVTDEDENEIEEN